MKLRAAVAVVALTLLVGAVYTRMLAERQGLTLTIGQTVHIGYVTQFYGLFVPGVIAGPSAGSDSWAGFASLVSQGAIRRVRVGQP